MQIALCNSNGREQTRDDITPFISGTSIKTIVRDDAPGASRIKDILIESENMFFSDSS